MKEKETKSQSTWQVLSSINVNEHIEVKEVGNGRKLSYLSWAWAWGVLKEQFPDASYEVREWDNKPYLYDEKLGYLVETSLTIDGCTMSMRLPVMDGSNKAMKAESYTYGKYNKQVEAATMFDINTAIMRCLVKNMALFGLGHYIYAGEDLPQVEIEAQRELDIKLQEAIAKINKCKSLDELKATYEEYPQLSNNKVLRSAINSRAKAIES